MKKNTLLLGLIALLFLFACKQSSEFKKTMKIAKEVAKNAKEMQKEEAKKSDVEKNKLFPEDVIKAMNLKNTKDILSLDRFEKVKKCIDAYNSVAHTEKDYFNNKNLTELFKPCGYSSFDTAYKEIKEVATLNDFLMSAGIRVAGLKTARLLDGKEGYDKAIKELSEKINKKGYTANDLRNLENNKDIIATTLGLTIKLQPYLKKKE
ncbi:hypothetical protein J7L48_03105 [bacterium]|nr:hypothetical protein [bacterium]